MNKLLLCSHNPILIKSLYGLLRDDGYDVEMADYPALAVQMSLKKNYNAIVIGSEPFGLSAEDAIEIIRSVSPDVPIIIVGAARHSTEAWSIKEPVDLEEFKQVMHEINHAQGISTLSGSL